MLFSSVEWKPTFLKKQCVPSYLYVFMNDFYVISERINQLFQAEGLLFCICVIQENVAKFFK